MSEKVKYLDLVRQEEMEIFIDAMMQNPTIRFEIAQLEQTPTKLLDIIAIKKKVYKKYENDDERYQVAKNKNTSKETIENLSNDIWRVREGVASNETASPEILEKLSNDSIEHVRCRVARNQNTPYHVLEALSKDENVRVRESLARNIYAPLDLLEKIEKEDENQNVREAVRETFDRFINNR